MAKQTAKNLPKSQVVKLDNYSEIKESELTALVKKYDPMVVTAETYKDGLKARQEIRAKRFEIQNITKNNKALLNGAKKTLDSRAEQLIAIIQPVEDKIDGRIKEIEAEKARIKAEKEAEKQRLQAERMEKISKIQKEFSSALIQASTLKNIDEIQGSLNGFKVTEEEFGDLKMACETTISGIQFDINMARTRIENEIEAEKERVLDEAKEGYLKEAGKFWEGEQDAGIIQLETKKVAAKKYRANLIAQLENLGGELPSGVILSIQGIEKLIEAKQKELADFAKQKREEERSLKLKRYSILVDAGVEDGDWADNILMNDHGHKSIEKLTDVEFETFLGNLIAINSEITKVDFEEVPVENPVVEEKKVEVESGGEVDKKEVVKGEFKEEMECWKVGKYNSVVVSNKKVKNTNFPSPPNQKESTDE